MEEVEFQKWVKQLQEQVQEHKYSVIYNPSTMQILQVGPSHALLNCGDNCLEIETDIAERILSGEISIHSCYLDADNGEIAITETKSLIKIDDVLHRIPNLKWCTIENPDVYLKLNSKKSKINIQLGVQWGGTFVSKNISYAKSRKIVWSGDTLMEFLITDYNDPNIIYDSFSFAIQDLMNDDLEFIIKVPHSEVSVYTKRIFKNYVVEYV